MTDDASEMGPIDFLVMEFDGDRLTGESLPLLVDLVDRGIIRILDLVFVRKNADSSVQQLELSDLSPDLAVFDGASSGLLDEEDMFTLADTIAADSTACIVVYENRWMAPLSVALRQGGAQLVASGRLHVQAIIAALDALEAKS